MVVLNLVVHPSRIIVTGVPLPNVSVIVAHSVMIRVIQSTVGRVFEKYVTDTGANVSLPVTRLG